MSTRVTAVTIKEKFRVWITGQVRQVTKPMRREMKRRADVEPVIGHTNPGHRMGRDYHKRRDGDLINAVLASAGYNFSPCCAGWPSFARAHRGRRCTSGLKPPLTASQPTGGNEPADKSPINRRLKRSVPGSVQPAANQQPPSFPRSCRYTVALLLTADIRD